jgi:hypothetical protein
MICCQKGTQSWPYFGGIMTVYAKILQQLLVTVESVIFKSIDMGNNIQTGKEHNTEQTGFFPTVYKKNALHVFT